jgi:hypothetical protein
MLRLEQLEIPMYNPFLINEYDSNVEPEFDIFDPPIIPETMTVYDDPDMQEYISYELCTR